ncbi:MAG: hypothetical protein FWC26_03375, partial [Fibromonadales bacterium]|nr:hypothetical protein [Fibromonadales bacterium]
NIDFYIIFSTNKSFCLISYEKISCFLRLVILMFCISCEYVEPAGLCSDPMKLSKDKLFFNAGGGIDSVDIGYYWLTYDEIGCKYIGPKDELDYCDNNYCANGITVVKIECPWLEVMLIDYHTLLVSVNKNVSGEERKQHIPIQGGNCYSSFMVIQSAE